jgi:diguanylate cyclase (GGDEF)-like protein
MLSDGMDPEEHRVHSYRRLADIFHLVLSEQSLDAVLDRIASALEELIPYDTLTIYEANDKDRLLTPIYARDEYADEILKSPSPYGQGLTGWAFAHREPLLVNQAHLDPRVVTVPNTPDTPESMIVAPLTPRGVARGTLNVYREGETASFSQEEFQLVQRFADAAALAVDNAQIRARLEFQAQTDHLTGVFNHRYFHERLRSELALATRAHLSLGLVMLDIDDFKKVNDVYGHAVGDEVLTKLASILTEAVRASDVVCRLGGEEFGIIMPACDAGDALGLAQRLADVMDETVFGIAGRMTISIGVAQGPEHAMNPRELMACSEAAMMTAKARGKNQIVLFDEDTTERPEPGRSRRGEDIRSIAHLKMLQSLAGKLNRLSDTRQIGDTIAKELRTLIDYHNCRIYLEQDGMLVPIAFRGDLTAHEGERPALTTLQVGEGISGHVAATGKSLLIDNTLECEFAVEIPGTEEIEESSVVTAMTYASRVIGVIWISKLGIGQFDSDDVRLLEVLAGQASVALENARLYEAQRREASNALGLLELADSFSLAESPSEIYLQTLDRITTMVGAAHVSLWLQEESSNDFRCAAHRGFDVEVSELVGTTVSENEGIALLKDHREPFTLASNELPSRSLSTFVGKDGTATIAPLPALDGVSGWIALQEPPGTKRFFTEDKLRLLSGIAYQAALAMQRNALSRSQKESAEAANALLDLSMNLSAAEGLDEVLTRVVESCAKMLGVPKTSVWLEDPGSRELVCECAWGYNPAEREGLLLLSFPVDNINEHFETMEPFVLANDSVEGLPGGNELVGASRVAVAPLQLGANRTGAIAAAVPIESDFCFTDRRMRMLAGIASQTRLAINNAGNFESLESTFLSTVEALANALEAKDEYTSSHARSITDTSLEVGYRLGVRGRDLKRLELGALFHDIGKIGIPSDILLKPGPLTDTEAEVMRKHPELGEMILAPIDRLSDVRPIVRHCHEHYDGGGYPDGKVASQIPIESRIILVCDAYHAMTTDRPYRKKLSVEEACRRLREASGTQFDPEIVEIFLKMIEEDPIFGETA